RVVVLERGRVQQIASPVDLYERPANRFVAGFVGSPPMNLLPARYERGALRVGGQTITPGADLERRLATVGEDLTLGVRPEAFSPLAGAAPGGGLIAVTEPGSVEFLGGETLVSARVGEASIVVRRFGDGPLPARVVAPAASLHVFDAAGR